MNAGYWHDVNIKAVNAVTPKKYVHNIPFKNIVTFLKLFRTEFIEGVTLDPTVQSTSSVQHIPN